VNKNVINWCGTEHGASNNCRVPNNWSALKVKNEDENEDENENENEDENENENENEDENENENEDEDGNENEKFSVCIEVMRILEVQ
jgi:hypothetical protein